MAKKPPSKPAAKSEASTEARRNQIANAEPPSTLDEQAHKVENTFGEAVSCLLNSVTHIEDFMQGADYVGQEPVYCEFHPTHLSAAD